MKCQFIVSKKKPACGEPGYLYNLSGGLATTQLVLCSEHRDYCISNYGWKVEKINESIIR